MQPHYPMMLYKSCTEEMKTRPIFLHYPETFFEQQNHSTQLQPLPIIFSRKKDVVALNETSRAISYRSNNALHTFLVFKIVFEAFYVQHIRPSESEPNHPVNSLTTPTQAEHVYLKQGPIHAQYHPGTGIESILMELFRKYVIPRTLLPLCHLMKQHPLVY